MAKLAERPPLPISGWGRNPWVVAHGDFPASRAEALQLHTPRTPLPGSLPRGLGRSYGDAALPAAGTAAGTRFTSTHFLDRFIDFDPVTGILEAEAGVTLRDILEAFVPRGFFLPVTPGTQWVTLAGAAASNVHGKNHHHTGSIERFLTSLEVATPIGLFRCTPLEHPDLFRATVGGYGLTGLITRVGIRLKRIRSPFIMARSVRARNLSELFAAFREHDSASEYSVAWVDTLSSGPNLGRGILHLGDHAVEGDARGPAASRPPNALFDVPFATPAGLLQPWALQLFNAAYYHLPRPAKPGTTKYGGFFYPLDSIGNWNRLYGKPGFFQYQCALPDARQDAESGVKACLDYLSRHGMGSFLAVLKRCGQDEVLLPFCKHGYTLALDIPNRGAETLRRLEELDRIVLEYGGRVYLTKDARLPRETFGAMYPEWRDWMRVVKRYNPEGLGRSELSNRLGLWEA